MKPKLWAGLFWYNQRIKSSNSDICELKKYIYRLLYANISLTVTEKIKVTISNIITVFNSITVLTVFFIK